LHRLPASEQVGSAVSMQQRVYLLKCSNACVDEYISPLDSVMTVLTGLVSQEELGRRLALQAPPNPTKTLVGECGCRSYWHIECGVRPNEQL